MTTRALVLGGGGPVGIAWEAGVLWGLAETGVDLLKVDHVIGTSAGAFVGARVALGHAPADIAKPYLGNEETPSDRAAAPSKSEASSDRADLSGLFQKIQEGARAGRSPREIARDVGAFALTAKTMSEEDFVGRFAPILTPGTAWPTRSFACTAFDAEDGAFKIWDAEANVDLTRAVASSCAVPGVFPAITIGSKRYFDGGVLSTTNAHLAKGHDIVIVFAVMEVLMRYGAAREKKTPLQRETEALIEGGAQVEIVALDTDAIQVIGSNFMDRGRQTVALREGVRQGRAAADGLRKSVSPYR